MGHTGTNGSLIVPPLPTTQTRQIYLTKERLSSPLMVADPQESLAERSISAHGVGGLTDGVSPKLPPDQPDSVALSGTDTERPILEHQLGRALSDSEGLSRKARIGFQDR